jgi:hypothetical protein
MNKTKEAVIYKIKYTKAFEEANVEIKASVF